MKAHQDTNQREESVPHEGVRYARQLTCSCCGADAGRWKQYWNQDTGFGLCPKCRDWIWERNHPSMPHAEFERTYGVPGVNYEAWPDGEPSTESSGAQPSRARDGGNTSSS